MWSKPAGIHDSWVGRFLLCVCVVGQWKQTKCHLSRALMAAANQQQAFTRTPRISIYGVCGCRDLLVEAVESIDDQCKSAVVQTRGPKRAKLTKTLPTHAIESRKAHFPSKLHKARKSVCEALLCVWLPKALSGSKAGRLSASALSTSSKPPKQALLGSLPGRILHLFLYGTALVGFETLGKLRRAWRGHRGRQGEGWWRFLRPSQLDASVDSSQSDGRRATRQKRGRATGRLFVACAGCFPARFWAATLAWECIGLCRHAMMMPGTSGWRASPLGPTAFLVSITLHHAYG